MSKIHRLVGGISLVSLVAACSGAPTVPRTDQSPLQTEAIFQEEAKPDGLLGGRPDGESLNEWRAARADHRRIVAKLLSCKPADAPKIDLDNASRRVFSALLLDLTPDGDHIFKSTTKNQDGDVPLSSREQEILSLSDSIARSRVLAAKWASGSVDKVFNLGMAALVVSGLTTLFVTFQSRMAPPQPPAPAQPPGPAHPPTPPQPPGQGASPIAERRTPERDAEGAAKPISTAGGGGEPPRSTEPAERKGRWWGYLPWPSAYGFIATIAIILSVLGTSLAGVKQFYDPSRLLVQNQRTLGQLWTLHQDAVLRIGCPDDAELPKKLDEWNSQLVKLRAKVIPSYGAFITIESDAKQ